MSWPARPCVWVRPALPAVVSWFRRGGSARGLIAMTAHHRFARRPARLHPQADTAAGTTQPVLDLPL